ncbi:MAG: Gfo/Idh/MocA family oxidoreductase [Sphingomicrobium sp.]
MIRIAISGCGAVTQLYYRPALQALCDGGEAMLAGALDPDRTAAKRLCDAFPDARPVGSLDNLLALDIDLLVVASPPARHAEQACAAAAAGIAVLCEKPMALTVADAERMVAAAKSSSAPFAVAMVRRFLSQPRTIREMIAGEALGKLQRIDIFEGGRFDWPIASPAYFDPKRGGGGVLEDVGVHVLDLLRWWLGEPDTVRFADDALGGVAANCAIHLGFGPTEVAVRLSRDWYRPNAYRFTGERGWLEWAIHERDELEQGSAGETVGAIVPERDGQCAAGGYEQAIAAQLRAMTDAIRGKAGGGLVSAEDGLQTIRLLDQCRQSRVPMAMEWL